MSDIRALDKRCREAARDMVQSEYALYDRIWAERIRITEAVFDHGEDTVKEVNALMPNLLCYSHPELRTIDEAANDYGFGSTSDLVEYLLAYTPKKGKAERYYSEMFEKGLREIVVADMAMETETCSAPADMPF